jgi:hypothetical protein
LLDVRWNGEWIVEVDTFKAQCRRERPREAPQLPLKTRGGLVGGVVGHRVVPGFLLGRDPQGEGLQVPLRHRDIPLKGPAQGGPWGHPARLEERRDFGLDLLKGDLGGAGREAAEREVEVEGPKKGSGKDLGESRGVGREVGGEGSVMGLKEAGQWGGVHGGEDGVEKGMGGLPSN